MKMRNFYFAILPLICVAGDNPGKEDQLHEELKTGYGIKTTTKLGKMERYSYISFVLSLTEYCFDLQFDSDRYKNEGVVCYYQGKPFIFFNHNEKKKRNNARTGKPTFQLCSPIE